MTIMLTASNVHEAPREDHSPGASFVLEEPNSFLTSHYITSHDKRKASIFMGALAQQC